MKSLHDLCHPRKSVFDRQRRDVVLDLTDFVEGKVDGKTFFEENHLTDGMKRLLREAFRRFDRQSEQGIFVLSQAMGGGKTHNMIALSLLASNPGLRPSTLAGLYEPKSLGPVRVVAFTGRQSDSRLGIWGEIATQLGKKEAFNDYYSPLQAPGQTAWINLLKGEPLLILLDELPPYLDNARSVQIGNSDLAQVTTTAIANLLVAVSKQELANVCVVISDLRATYAAGSQRLNEALTNLRNEVSRSAMVLEPVGLNTDELYHILRRRIFDNLPNEDEFKLVTAAYAQAVKDAKQMDITNASPEQFAAQLQSSFPFHFAIRDLYARFRENPGFQQTRGLIRLMRTVVASLWDNGRAKKQSLIHAYDLDLNDRDTLTEIQQINPSLDNAISHDIASAGGSVAENLDANLKSGSDAQDAARLLLVASLANIPNATLGLSLQETVSLLCQPGRDIARLPKDILGVLATKAWYLHSSRDGKLFFKNVENLNAKLKTRADTYNREARLREMRAFLERIFSPSLKDCYQRVAALPALDELALDQDATTLVIFEPHPSGGLHPDLVKFYNDASLKNRVCFLSGDRETAAALLDAASELRAIASILKEMEAEKVSENDPQRVLAGQLQDTIQLRLLSAARESFTKLHYPYEQSGKPTLLVADFLMQFAGNDYNGEKQIREALKSKMKWTDEISSDTFRKKCEERLFTQQVMPFAEVKKRAAMAPRWQWHHPSALDDLLARSLLEGKWREQGELIDKGPFAPPKASVSVQELKRDSKTGSTTLRLTALNADTIHYEIGASATPASSRVENPSSFDSSELRVNFLAVDSTGIHASGEQCEWRNRIELRHRFFLRNGDRFCELESAPGVPMRYTCDGSDPKHSGGAYGGPFVVPKGALVVLAVGEKDGVSSGTQRFDVPAEGKDEEVKIDPNRPALWKRSIKADSTKDAYEILARLKKFGAVAPGVRVTISGSKWIELTTDAKLEIDPSKLEEALRPLREILGDGDVRLAGDAIRFDSGQALLDWIAEEKIMLKPGDVQQ